MNSTAWNACPLPSPTLTNPDLVLPDDGGIPITATPPRTRRPPSPTYLLDHVPDHASNRGAPAAVGPVKSLGSVKTRSALHGSGTADGGVRTKESKTAPPIQDPRIEEGAQEVKYRKSLGSMSTRLRLQRSSTPEDHPWQLGKSRNKSPEDHLPDSAIVWKAPITNRPASVLSASTTSLDLDAIPDYRYDGEESDIITNDDVDSAGTLTPTRSKSMRNESPAARVRARSRSTSRSRLPGNSSAELSRRAELILANAKKRLNLMDENLRGARALTAENLSRATSMHAHRTPYTNRYFSNGVGTDGSESTQTLKMGHVRGRSDNTIVHMPRRSDMPLTAQIVHEEADGSDLAAPELRVSRSQELPRLTPLRSRSKLGRSSMNLGTVLASPAGSGSGSSPATKELKNQVQELNRRVSFLRDRTREDSLRRQSFLNLRKPSAFTDAEQDQNDGSVKKSGSSLTEHQRTGSNLTSRWSVDSSVKRVSTMIPGSSPTSVYSTPSDKASNVMDKRRSRGKVTDWSPVSPRPVQSLSRFSRDTVQDELEEEEGEGEEEGEEEEEGEMDEDTNDQHPIDLGITTEQAHTPAHEDRADAFDYHNCFLHSTLGRADGMSDGFSEDSDDTARGPTRGSLPDESETPEKLREIEKMMHRRFSSLASTSSGTSFATATEGLGSRQPSPIKRTNGSDGADSGVAMNDKGGRAPPQQARLSTYISSQVRAISAPPSTIAMAALAVADKQPLGLRDKAVIFTLLECVRHACERLQDHNVDRAEGAMLRWRMEEARKVLEGTSARFAW